MLCLRAFALRPRLVERIRAAGVTTLVWFADDPVLYKVGYRHVVESYDVVLHCGPAAVLDFYERRHGATGVNFPFWTDTTAFPYAHEPAAADVDAIFLGSTVGQVRARRYGLLAEPARRSARPGTGRDRPRRHRPPLPPRPRGSRRGAGTRPRRHQPRPALRRLSRTRVRLPRARGPWLVRAPEPRDPVRGDGAPGCLARSGGSVGRAPRDGGRARSRRPGRAPGAVAGRSRRTAGARAPHPRALRAPPLCRATCRGARSAAPRSRRVAGAVDSGARHPLARRRPGAGGPPPPGAGDCRLPRRQLPRSSSRATTGPRTRATS